MHKYITKYRKVTEAKNYKENNDFSITSDFKLVQSISEPLYVENYIRLLEK